MDKYIVFLYLYVSINIYSFINKSFINTYINRYMYCLFVFLKSLVLFCVDLGRSNRAAKSNWTL